MQNAVSLQQKPTQFKLSKITLQCLSKFDISPTAKLVLLYLIDCYNPAKVYMFPKQDTISDKLGISASSVRRGIKELSKAALVVIELKFSNRYSLTPKFFEVINMTPDRVQNEQPPCQNDMNHVITEKELYKEKEQNFSFSFKKLSELLKIDTIAYYEQVSKLSEEEKEHLCKVKLNRISLTAFQKENIDKLIMLNEYEINKINSLEPYFKAENITLYFNDRIKKIKKAQESPKLQENTPKNERQEIIAMLSTGYKVFSKNKRQLTDFLSRNSFKMEQWGISEIELINHNS